jgi:predicted MPP superfamily phosphohydrolase
MPNAPVDLPLLHSGLHIDLTQFDVSVADHKAIDSLAALASQFNTGVNDPIINALAERLALGAGIGTAIGGYLGYKALRNLRETSLVERVRRAPRRAAVLGAACLALVGGCAAVNNGTDLRNDTARAPKLQPLSPDITDHVSALKGATVSGLGSDLPNVLAHGAVQYIDNVHSFWKEGSSAFENAYEKYRQGEGSRYAQNPAIKPVLHLSDLHCNYANYEHYLGTVLNDYRPSVIVNTGDTFTNSGKAPYEKDCFSNFVDDVDKAAKANDMKITVINVAGNHDDKKAINFKQGNTRVITLKGDKNTAKVEGITFVGDADPRVTILYPTLPDNVDEQNQLLAKQGENIAGAACKITEKDPDTPVVAASHSIQASYETILKGCAGLVMNGHTHHAGKVESFLGENNHDVLQHTAGSASGADVGFTIFETPKQDASVTVHYFNTAIRQFVGASTPTLHTDGTVDIYTQEYPKAGKAGEREDMQSFLETYTPANAKGSVFSTKNRKLSLGKSAALLCNIKPWS